MIRTIALVLCFLLGSIVAAWAAHMPSFSYGQRYGAEQLDFDSVFAGGQNSFFTISGTQPSGQTFPYFNLTYPFEPGGPGGRAFEFVVNGEGGGGSPWSNPTNSIFNVENGIGGGGPQIVDIYGNLGLLIFNIHNNGLLLNKWDHFTPVDGDFDYLISNTEGFTQIIGTVYSYDTDGDSTVPGDFFTMTVSISGHSFNVDFLCNSGGFFTTTSQFQTPSIFAIPTHEVITVSFSNTANCDIAMPQLRQVSLFFTYTTSP